MNISTYCKDQEVTGYIRSHTKYFLEVEITSPYSNYLTSCTVPYFARGHSVYSGEGLVDKCNELLTELCDFGTVKEKHFTELSIQFSSSEIPGQCKKINALEDEFNTLKPSLRKQLRSGLITQKQHQEELKGSRRLINEARNKLDLTTDMFFQRSKFSNYGHDLRSVLLTELENSAN